MPAIVVAYLIAAFAGGALAGSWHNHNGAVRELHNIEHLELERDELTQMLQNPGCDIGCREIVWKKRGKVEAKIARYERKFQTTGSRALAMDLPK